MSGGDPNHGVAHRANRQFNRQNPAFANRPTPGHFDHTSKWPVPQRWSAAGPENVMPKLPYAEDANGNDRSLPLMPRHDSSLTPEVLLAALNDDADRLRDLLSRGAGTECRTETGATPLICAAAKGADAAVEVLLECDANVVATDKVGANCLTLAAYHGRLETARKILASRAVRDSDGASEALLKWPTVGGETPLMAAAKNGHAEFVTFLLEAMRGTVHPLPPYDDGGDRRRVTAMQLACRRGKLDAVKALVAGGAPIGERSGPRQMTPLMHAACQGQNEVCAFLLNPSKSLTQTFRQANEGAHEAADPTAKDADALTALLHAACATGVGPPSVDRDEPARRCFLTLAHAWPGGPEAAYQARDSKGRNALMLSARFGNEAIFKTLLAETGAASLARIRRAPGERFVRRYQRGIRGGRGNRRNRAAPVPGARGRAGDAGGEEPRRAHAAALVRGARPDGGGEVVRGKRRRHTRRRRKGTAPAAGSGRQGPRRDRRGALRARQGKVAQAVIAS
jgi:ankyrin repeat protein